MRVIPEAERLQPPFLCFLCETHIQREAGVRVIDTGRDFDPAAPVHLKGRKVVCERCVDEAARLLGYVKSEDVDMADKALQELREHTLKILPLVQGLEEDIKQRLLIIGDFAPRARTQADKVIKEERENG